MGTTHRGEPTGDNHRPTPRLVAKLAKYHGLDRTDTQNRLNKYRDVRDNPSNTYDFFESYNTADDIREGLGQPRKDFYQHYEDRGEMDKFNAQVRAHADNDNTPYPYRGYGDNSPTGGYGWGY
jgi:hypothetical protein